MLLKVKSVINVKNKTMLKTLSIFLSALTTLLYISCDDNPLESDDELLLWKKELNKTLLAFSDAGITIDDKVLYFTDEYNQLFGLTSDGEDVMTFDIKNGSTFGIPVIWDSIIVVGTSNSGANPGVAHLYALNKNTFKVIWSKHNLWWYPIPAIDESQIYCTDLNKVYAFDKMNGQEVWSKEILGKNTYNAVVENDRLYFATGGIFKGDGYLYCLNKFSGEVIFQDTIPLIEENNQQYGGSSAGVEIWNDYIYVPSDNRYLYCFNKYNGQVIWKFLANSPMETPPRVSEGIVYTGSLNRTCYAINAETGELVWSFQEVGSIDRNPPQFYGNYVLFENGAILIFDKHTGDLVLQLTPRKGRYNYFSAVWDTDGKFFATGYDIETDQNLVFAYQF